MSARGPRAGRCPPGAGGQRANIAGPSMTRTEMLRQAKTAAVVQRDPRGARAEKSGACPGARGNLSRRGPPPAEPRKVDFKRPGLTKSMQMRQKVAAEKLQRFEEGRRAAEEAGRCPRRTPAPEGGDARMGGSRRDGPGDLTRLNEAVACGRVTTRRGRRDGQDDALDDAIERGHIVADRRGAIPKKRRPCPPAGTRREPSASSTAIPAGAKELARSMNAQVVQAVPMSDGPVDKIIIEPGIVSQECSTIVCIGKPPVDECAGGSGAASRSIQVINESLDEQDALERSTVQGKLEDLQIARRDFVMAVANVGGNAVNLSDENGCSILEDDSMPEALDYIPSPPPPPRRIYNIPDVTHPMFKVDYPLDHPDVNAAREFSRRARLDEMAAQRRMEEGFAARAEEQIGDYRCNVPYEQNLMDADISLQSDDEGNVNPCAPRMKTSMPRIPNRRNACPQPPITIEELQRFMDLEKYPPTPQNCNIPPPGRENLNPDLWGLDDPWYHEPPQPDISDLMGFDTMC